MATKVGPLSRVHYHLQDKPNFCGHACVQMVLSFASPAFARLPTQAGLRRRLFDGSDPVFDWHSGPDNIAGVVNKTLRRNPPYAVHVNLDPVRLSYKLAWDLESLGRPAFVPIASGLHWVLVTGLAVDRLPTGPDDTGFVIETVFYLNPREGAGKAPPLHRFGDVCPQGGAGDGASCFEEWCNEVFSAIQFGRWAGMRVIVGSEMPPPVGDLILPGPAPEGAADDPLAALDAAGIFVHPRFQALLGSSVAPGIRVRRLEGAGEDLIVPLQREGATVGLVSVTLPKGSLGSVILVPHGSRLSGSEPIPSPEQAVAEVRTLVGPGKVFVVKPIPVWLPGVASSTPFEPFYEVDLGAAPPVAHYYRQGRLFTRQELGVRTRGG